jgi:hypothetical protein
MIKYFIQTDHIYDMLFVNCNWVVTRGSSTVHIYTQTIQRTIQQLEECWPCPVLASYTLAFALQLRKKHGKTSVRVAGECQLVRCKQNIQNRVYIYRTEHTVTEQSIHIEQSIKYRTEHTIQNRAYI